MIALLVMSCMLTVALCSAIYFFEERNKCRKMLKGSLDDNAKLLQQQDALAAKIKEHGAPVGEFRPPKFLNQNAVVFRRARLATMDHLFTDKEMLRARKRFDQAVKRGWIKDHDPIVTTDGLGESWTEFTGTGGTAIITY